jgi:hypothetical protein
MAIQIVDNFQVNIAQAIDNRLVVGPGQFYTNKDSLPYKYAGMRVWDLNVNIPYVWDGATFSTEAASSVSGSGTANYIPKFVSPGNVIQNSIIYDNATNVGIGTITPDKKLTVNGDIKSMVGFGFYGNGSQITNINASNITSGTLQLTYLQNSPVAQPGSILVSALSQPVYTFNMTVDSPPLAGSGGSTLPGVGGVPGVVTVLNFKNFAGPSRIYSYDSGDTTEFRFENHPGGTYLYLRPGFIDTNVPLRVSSGSAGSPSLSFTSDPDTGIYKSGTNQLGFTTGGSNRMSLSTTQLSILSTVTTYFYASGSAASPTIKIADTNTGIFSDSLGTMALSANGYKIIKVNSSGADFTHYNGSTFQSTNTSGANFTFAGSVQIQVPSTGVALAINLGYYSSSWRHTYNSPGMGFFFLENKFKMVTTNAAVAGTPATLYDVFRFSPIGTSEPRVEFPGGIYIDKSSNTEYSLQISNGGGSATCVRINAGSYDNAATTWIFASHFSGYTLPNYFNVTGAADVQADNFVNLSDVRTKENIETVLYDPNIISNLRPVTYTTKSTGESRVGFIAQEVEEIIPLVVSTSNHPEYQKEDYDGLLDIKHLNYSGIIPYIVAELKEKDRVISDLESRLKKLEG